MSVAIDKQEGLLSVCRNPGVYKITFEFEQLVNGHTVKCLTYCMWARTDFANIERARDQFLQSGMVTDVGWSSDHYLWDLTHSEIDVEIVDPDNVLRWLYPDSDLHTFFKNQNFVNDQPLRLPSANS